MTRDAFDSELSNYISWVAFDSAGATLRSSHSLKFIASHLSNISPTSVDKVILHMRGGSKFSTSRRDVKDISDELIIYLNDSAIHHFTPVMLRTLPIIIIVEARTQTFRARMQLNA